MVWGLNKMPARKITEQYKNKKNKKGKLEK